MNRRRVGSRDFAGDQGILPQTPTLLLSPTITTLSSSFLALNAVIAIEKERRLLQ